MTEVTFNAEIGKVLDIMIHSLYTNKDIFLRELISNASDACEKLRYNAILNQGLTEDINFKISVEIDRDANAIHVIDNGIGMNIDDMMNHLGTIAKSGTNEFIKKISDTKDNNKIMDMIGQFGVGFYSSFMVADKVTVKSRKAGESDCYIWESSANSCSYVVDKIDENLPVGTKVTLHLKEDIREEYLDKFRIKHIIESYSMHIDVPIYLKHEDKLDETPVNKNQSALWLRDKKDVKKEEYNDFFKSIAHLPSEPWMILHNKIEGSVNYANLLFVPGTKPFDLFHPDRQTRVKLYVKKVFITEQNLNIIPKYLRFLYGIIDCPDLPLNISRETLQDSNILNKIRDLITKKVLSELKNKQESDFSEYIKFWDNFGQVLKEGLCEPMSDRDTLLQLSMFKTVNSEKEYSTLEQYIKNMPEGQNDIYFYISETDDVASNPQIEGFTKKGIDVILLTDYVDNFWTTVVNECKGHNFKSINRSDIDLSQIKTKLSDNDNEEDKVNEDTKNSNDNNDEMIKLFEESLNGLVKKVKISNKLVDSPACLSIEDGAMDIKMEKFLISQGQMKTSSLKTLEINPNNQLIKKAFDLLKSDKPRGNDLVISIFDIACISQDEILQHPNKFARRVFKILSDL